MPSSQRAHSEAVRKDDAHGGVKLLGDLQLAEEQLCVLRGIIEGDNNSIWRAIRFGQARLNDVSRRLKGERCPRGP